MSTNNRDDPGYKIKWLKLSTSPFKMAIFDLFNFHQTIFIGKKLKSVT